jgi:hypothetical protein
MVVPLTVGAVLATVTEEARLLCTESASPSFTVTAQLSVLPPDTRLISAPVPEDRVAVSLVPVPERVVVVTGEPFRYQATSAWSCVSASSSLKLQEQVADPLAPPVVVMVGVPGVSGAVLATTAVLLEVTWVPEPPAFVGVTLQTTDSPLIAPMLAPTVPELLVKAEVVLVCTHS